MGATHGRKGIIYKWNGSGSDLTNEATTDSGNNAQITDSAKRLLNPNADITVSGQTVGVGLKGIDHVSGTAKFDDPPGASVVVSGTGAYVPSANLIRTGYLYEWEFNSTLDTEELTAFQDEWKTRIVGQADGSGSAAGYLVGSNWWDDFEDMVDGTNQYFFLQLFTYDPDDDRTGDHFDCWVVFPSFGTGASINAVVKENIAFALHGAPQFVANV